MFTCPFCMWPSIAVSRDPAMDLIGNEFHHGQCKQCNCEVLFIRKAETGITAPKPA